MKKLILLLFLSIILSACSTTTKSSEDLTYTNSNLELSELEIKSLNLALEDEYKA